MPQDPSSLYQSLSPHTFGNQNKQENNADDHYDNNPYVHSCSDYVFFVPNAKTLVNQKIYTMSPYQTLLLDNLPQNYTEKKVTDCQQYTAEPIDVWA